MRRKQPGLSVSHVLVLSGPFSSVFSAHSKLAKHGCHVSFLELLKQITKNLGAQDNRNIFSHSSGCEKSKIKVSAGAHSLWRLQARIHSLPLLVSGGCRQSLAFLGLQPYPSISASVFTSPLVVSFLWVCYMDTWHWI